MLNEPPQLCLGTAQFGLNYGITNFLGKVDIEEIFAILRFAKSRGIKYIDTAHSYGNSQEILGRYMVENGAFQIISKLSPQDKILDKDDLLFTWENEFQNTLSSLKLRKINSFLLHRASDLQAPFGELLLEWINTLKERKLISRFGVSIYSSNDLEHISLDNIDIIQLPFSLYDQRLLNDGTISQLIDKGISLHARSIFLQGLLLQPASLWPNFLSKDFRKHHLKLESFSLEYSLSLLELCLCFLKDCSFFEAVVFGVLDLKQLESIIDAWTLKEISSDILLALANLAWNNSLDLDPRSWPKK